MKILTRAGIVTAEAENVEDVRILLGLTSSTDAKHIRKRRNATRICDICGKTGLKNVLMHKKIVHEGIRVGMAARKSKLVVQTV